MFLMQPVNPSWRSNEVYLPKVRRQPSSGLESTPASQSHAVTQDQDPYKRRLDHSRQQTPTSDLDLHPLPRSRRSDSLSSPEDKHPQTKPVKVDPYRKPTSEVERRKKIAEQRQRSPSLKSTEEPASPLERFQDAKEKFLAMERERLEQENLANINRKKQVEQPVVAVAKRNPPPLRQWRCRDPEEPEVRSAPLGRSDPDRYSYEEEMERRPQREHPIGRSRESLDSDEFPTYRAAPDDKLFKYRYRSPPRGDGLPSYQKSPSDGHERYPKNIDQGYDKYRQKDIHPEKYPQRVTPDYPIKYPQRSDGFDKYPQKPVESYDKYPQKSDPHSFEKGPAERYDKYPSKPAPHGYDKYPQKSPIDTWDKYPQKAEPHRRPVDYDKYPRKPPGGYEPPARSYPDDCYTDDYQVPYEEENIPLERYRSPTRIARPHITKKSTPKPKISFEGDQAGVRRSNSRYFEPPPRNPGGPPFEPDPRVRRPVDPEEEKRRSFQELAKEFKRKSYQEPDYRPAKVNTPPRYRHSYAEPLHHHQPPIPHPHPILQRTNSFLAAGRMGLAPVHPY